MLKDRLRFSNGWPLKRAMYIINGKFFFFFLRGGGGGGIPTFFFFIFLKILMVSDKSIHKTLEFIKLYSQNSLEKFFIFTIY